MTRPTRPFTRRTFLGSIGMAVTGYTAGCIDTTDDDTDAALAIETVATGFDQPWALAMHPTAPELFVTELGGRLSIVDRTDGTTTELDGLPAIAVGGQGGLLDIELEPGFDDGGWLYLTYVGSDGNGGRSTHLGRARFDREGATLTEFEVLYVVEPFRGGTRHFGSRVVFDDDGMLVFTSGDRGDGTFTEEHPSQDTTTAIGSTVRLTPDGDIPGDNPFVDDPRALDELYTTGHRNPQGLTVHPETGELWQSEHGEHDGDMLHLLEAGGNYGWPIAHTGCAYGSTDPVGDNPFERDDIVNPVYHWECTTGGFPPAGMTFYDGEAFPAFEGDLFVGNLAGEYLGRFTVDGREVEEVDPLLAGEGWRIRDVAVDPDDGHLYVAIDAEDTELIRFVPA